MGKSSAGSGTVHLLDDPVRIAATVRAAVTDLDPALTYDPELRPGVANLAELLAALTGRTPPAALAGLRGAGALKAAVTEALVETLRPVRVRYAELTRDPAEVDRRLASDAATAAALATPRSRRPGRRWGWRLRPQADERLPGGGLERHGFVVAHDPPPPTAPQPVAAWPDWTSPARAR